MRYLLVALLLIPTFGAQINPWVGGAPTNIQEYGDYYIVSTLSTLYIFDDKGLINQLNLEGISDFSINNDVLVVTLLTQDFPNIRAYTFPDLTSLWDYEPTTPVFDLALIWDQKQTRSWSVKPVGDGFGVTSGYSFFFFSKSGEVYANYTADSDIWDFEGGDQKFYLGTQEGAVYYLDSDLNFLRKETLCEPYVLRNEVSNNTIDTYPRSIWFISDGAAVCEDGYIHFFNRGTKFQVKEFTNSQLYSIYKKTRRESGYGSSMFENIKLKTSDEYEVAYTSENLMVFSKGVPKFDLTGSFNDVDLRGGKIYTLSISQTGLETTRIYDIESNKLEKTIETHGLDCDENSYKILGGDNVLISGVCETKLIDSSNSKILWYLPTSSKVDVVSDDLRVFFTDDKGSQGGRPSFYSMMGYSDKILWTYSLSEKLARSGSLVDVKVIGDTAVAQYSSDDGFGGLVIVYKNGTSLYRNGTSRKYIGDFDKYLSNSSIVSQVKNFSFEVLDSIPYEVKYGQSYDISDYDPLSILYWTGILENLPMPISLMEQIRNDYENLNDYWINPQINSLSECDYDSDGISDLVINGDGYFTILSGKNFTELIFKDQNAWRYPQDQQEKFTASWYNEGGNVVCVDDFSGDGLGELVFSSWSGNISLITDKVVWSLTYKNLDSQQVKVIDDVDGDNIKDLYVSRWVQDKPNDVFFLSTINGRQRAIFSSHQTFYETNSADVDGDGLNENILIYSSDDLSLLSVFSPTYKFEYDGIKDFWSTWSDYGVVLPVEIIPDVDGDNFNDIIIGASRKWGKPANILMIYSGKTKDLIETIYIDGESESEIHEEDWQYFPEVKRFGELLTLVIPGQNEGGKSSGGRFGVYNLTSKEMVAYFNHDVKSAVEYGDKIILLGRGGEVYVLNQTDFLKPTVDTSGAEVHVTSSLDYYTTVYVDGGVAGSGRKDNFVMRLPNGDHKVTVSLVDGDGFEKLYTYEVSTFTSTSLSFLNNSLIAILILFGGVKVIKKWKSQ